MEVVGDSVRNPESSIWTSPLSLADQKQHVSTSLPRSESAPQSIFDGFAQPSTTKRNFRTHTRSHSISQPFDFLDHGHDQDAVSLGIHSMLLEDDNEDAPVPLPPAVEHQAGLSDSGLSSSSMSGSSVVQDPLGASPSRLSQLEHQAQKMQSASAALGSNPVAQRPPTQPASSLRSFGSSRRHPSRSVSSIELAAIMNGSAASHSHGISAVPAHVSGTASFSTGDRLAKHRSTGSKASVNWPKSVFDMIQDDFPRTPSPMLSSMIVTSKSVNNAREMRSSIINPRIPAAERRLRGQSTASLDLDFGLFGKPSDSNADPTTSLGGTNELRRRSAPNRGHHRRSVSVNWTGDFPGLLEEQPIAQSSQHSALKSSKSSIFSGKQVQIATPATEAKQPTQQSLPVASSADNSHAPSPHASIAVGGNRPPASAAAAAAAAAAASTANSSSPLSSAAKRSPIVQPTSRQDADEQMAGQINSNVLQPNFSGSEPPVHIPQPDLSGPELGDYNFLYEHPDPRFPATAPASVHAAPAVHNGIDGAFHHADVGTTSNMHLPNPLQSGSPYSAAFPSFGMVPTPLPFSNNAASLNSASPLPPGYAHTFRDGLAAAGNLKTMSMQMAAFFNVQQQLYAAQMAQMAALTNGASFNGANLFNNPNHAAHFNAHMNPPAQQHHGRNPWDNQPSPQRNGGRGKNYSDAYKNSNSAHMNGAAKKGSTLDTPGSKSRGGRGRRGNRMHDDGGQMGSHKMNDRFGMGNNTSGGNLLDPGHSRSALLEEFRSTSLSIGRGMIGPGEIGGGAVGGYGGSNGSSGNREWQLSEITNHVVEFATDQHGSRFIQQKLESATKEDKMAILKHALTDAQRLMTDVFGNYVVQKLLDHGGAEAVASISSELEGRMLSLSLHMYGCRVVQKALEVLQPAARSKLVHELNGHVLKCIRDQNGNHVIQKCVELVEPDAVQFIVDAVQGQSVTLAGHSYGCRVVQRILEHGAPHQKAPIMVEIMADIPNLIKDQYGNYVIQHVVEHGTQQERSIIMNLVRGEVCQLSQHKFASNVVERCLQFGSVEEREVLVEILTVGDGPPNPSPLNHLVRDQFGNYVVQRVLDVARPAQRDRVANILKAQVPAIKKYSYGKHIIARLEENLGLSGTQQFQHGGPQGHGVLNGSHTGLHSSQRTERPPHLGMPTGHGQASMYSHQ